MASMNGWNARHELERQRRREFEAQEREKRGREIERDLLAAEKRVARLDARREVLLEQARANPDLIEALRLRAWAKLGKVEGRAADPESLIAPEGWPEGADPEAAVAEALAGLAGQGQGADE